MRFQAKKTMKIATKSNLYSRDLIWCKNNWIWQFFVFIHIKENILFANKPLSELDWMMSRTLYIRNGEMVLGDLSYEHSWKDLWWRVLARKCSCSEKPIVFQTFWPNLANFRWRIGSKLSKGISTRQNLSFKPIIKSICTFKSSSPHQKVMTNGRTDSNSMGPKLWGLGLTSATSWNCYRFLTEIL